ncbi:pentatricopeptide repeat-containing protein At2g35030, mitochondrial-like [Lolium rigidum]|uniref:pentatricopeptide repeat-containing protein At2g35030, mitochondrial-like n=1 Tax=Lolium rigidum TaxID=89674 RepID=UPI001F5C8C91|nr:pentatricopeptide repeat-containing protein At2g35030, mitochondrial-like [Lolium rigidum]
MDWREYQRCFRLTKCLITWLCRPQTKQTRVAEKKGRVVEKQKFQGLLCKIAVVTPPGSWLETMPGVFHVLRRRRRRRLLLRPILQTISLRLHGALANHPDQHPRLPANDTPAAAGLDEKPRRAYAATISAHLRSRDLPRAEALFLAAPASARGPHLDGVMLDGYLKAGRVDRARRLFDGMAEKNVVAWTGLVSAYGRDGRVAEARALFDAMPERDVVSWTAMLQGYVRAGMLREAREVFDEMPWRNAVTWTVMVKAYADGGHVGEAMALFDRMPERNSYSWLATISGFLRAGRVDEAVSLFERMHHKNVATWTVMVSGLAQNSRISMAREFFDKMPKNKDIVAWNVMINAYANDGQMSEARGLFDSMPAKDLVSWSTVIKGYARNGRKDDAMGLFLLMLRSAVYPDITTLTSVLVTSERTVEVGHIHGMATKIVHLSETSLGNALLTMYSKSGELRYAWQAFKMLREKDVITWTSMMQAFANHGHASCALQAFALMLRHGHEPSSSTFTVALTACSRAGLVEKGRNIFRSISAYGLKPVFEHRRILIRMVRAREATEGVAAMPLEMRDQEMEKKKSKKKCLEDTQLAIDEPVGVESAAAAATECTPTKGLFGWALAYLKAVVGK